MEKLVFGVLQAVYNLESRYMIDNEVNYCSVFNSTLSVKASYEKEKNYYRFIVNRSNVFLDRKRPVKKMDKIINEIGNSLYPLCLEVSPFLQIIDVTNIEEIKVRRHSCTTRLLNENPSDDLKEYIRLSEKILSDRKSFINSLYQDVFFNLYFRNIFIPTSDDEVQLMQWRNFPLHGMNQSFLYTIKNIEEKQVHLAGEVMKIVPESNGTFDIEYKVGDEGEIYSIGGEVETNYDKRNYIKRLSLRAESIKTGSSFLESVIIDE